MTEELGPDPARARALHTVAIVAFAVDATLFFGLMRIEGVPVQPRIALQYAARIAAAAAIAAVLVVSERARPARLGLSFAGFAADARWTAKVIALLLGVSLVCMAAAVAVIRIFDVPLTGWPLEWRHPVTRRFGAEQIPMYLLNAVLLAPLSEELVYRGLMVPGLAAAYGRRGAVAAGAVVFYALHLVYGQPFWMVHYLVGGAILTWAFIARGKLWICALLHLGGNLMVVLDDAVLLWAPGLFKAIVGRLP